MRVFIVTTEQLPSLAREIEIQFPSWTLEIVNQFDLRNASSAEALKHVDSATFQRRYGVLPSKGAVGCALAHRYCYQRLLELGEEYALVFEDDIVASTVNSSLIESLLSSGLQFDVVNLGSRDAVVVQSPRLSIAGYGVHRCMYYSHDTHAYLLSRTGARKLLAAQTPVVRGWADYPEHPWLLRFFVVLPRFIALSERPTGVQTKPLSTDRPALANRLVFKARRAFWRSLGWFRTEIMRDLRIGNDPLPTSANKVATPPRSPAQ